MSEKTSNLTRRDAPASGSLNTSKNDASPADEKSVSKIAMLANLLRRKGGASLVELVAATGWQPHTTRAALTGLRKKGHTITKEKVDGVTRHTIAAAPQS